MRKGEERRKEEKSGMERRGSRKKKYENVICILSRRISYNNILSIFDSCEYDDFSTD